MRDKILKLLQDITGRGARFADVRIEKYSITVVEMQDGVVRVAKQGEEEGAAVRVLYGGSWGFSSTSEVTVDSVRRALDRAFSAARAVNSAGEGDVDVALLDPLEDDVIPKLRNPPAETPFTTKLGDLRKLNDSIYGSDRVIKSVTIKYADAQGVTTYLSSDGRDISQGSSLTWAYLWVTGRVGDRLASAREEVGTTDGYTIWERFDPNELTEKLVRRVKLQLRAKAPKAGKFPAVLAPNVVGVFVHEAFGHLSEADLTMSGSAVKDRVGSKIASELVTIVDDPTIEGGFGSFKYDDEGVEARPAYLIKDGYVRELLVDREYAKRLGVRPTGNARAESYRVPPLIRMRNTVLLPRDYSVDELFEGIKFGYYLVAFRGGEANLDGTFQVGIQEAYEIVNGKVGEPVRDVSISGNTLKTLELVDAVAKDFSLEYSRCGKGQTAFVSDGGPHVRVKEIVVGGTA